MTGGILVISPHTDDAELACGGTIAKLVEQKKDVHILALSSASKSLPSNFKPDSTKKEMFQACKILGLDRNHVQILDFEVRVFSAVRQEILDTLIKIKKDLEPRIIMVPSLKDTHQDHEVVSRETLRAFKRSSLSIYGYEQPWNCFTFDTVAFSELSERHMKKKIRALLEYKSQSHRGYVDPDLIMGIARTRGVHIGKKYAESFEVIKEIIV